MGFFDSVGDVLEDIAPVVLGGAATLLTGGAISGGKTSPKFSNLGVTDPTTGKPVYLSSGDISNVMGATGGVAPTKFQAATGGFFKGMGQGQQFVGNVAEVRRTNAQTAALETENQVAQQQVLARTNQAEQQAIQAKITTEKLQADNTVLQAVKSGDPAALTQVITNPDTMLSAFELEKEVQAGFGKLQANGLVTPQQMTDFNAYKRALSIYKQGDLQSQWQSAAQAAAETMPIQALQQASGLPMEQFLGQMRLEQAPRGVDPTTGEPSFDPGGMQLVAPNGARVTLDEKDAEKVNPIISKVFGTRSALQNPVPGEFSLPLTPPSTPPPQAASPMPVSALPQTQAATPTLPNTGVAAPSATGSPSPVQTSATVNPNNISATGASLNTTAAPLALYNTKTTYNGNPISGDLAREAHKIFMADRQTSMKDAYDMASKVVAKLTPPSPEVAAQVAKGDIAAEEGFALAREIRAVVEESNALGYPLGPTKADLAGRVISNIPIVGGGSGGEVIVENPDGSKTKKIIGSLGDVQSRLSKLQGKFSLNLISTYDITAKYIDTPEERKKLEAMGPGFNTSDREMFAIADNIEANARRVQDVNYLTRFYDTLGVPKLQADGLIAEYISQNPSLVWDETTSTFILPKNRTDVVRWAQEKQGVDYNNEVARTFSSPTTLPKPASTEAPAPATNTPEPFNAAKKQDAAAFPKAEGGPELRGAAYNETPTTLKDLKAIAETARTGGSIKLFQTSGSVPRKLDQATPDLVARVIGAEALPGKTPGTVKVNSVSPTGVKGIMQVTQATFKEQAPDSDIPLTDRTDPLQSVVAGTQYLNKMLKRFDGNVDLALAAYNAGPGTVEGILDRKGLSTARTTIDMIADDLPKSQPTAAYVKQITSRGRVGASPEREKGKGFFDNFSLVATAEAEEFPTKEATPARKAEVAQKIASGEITDLGTIGPSNAPPKPTPDDSGIPSAGGFNLPTASTDVSAKVEPMDTSPRSDVPPVSEIRAALNDDYVKGIKPYEPIATRAVKWVRESPVGKFLGEVKQSQGMQAAETYVNALTSGFYDEGVWALAQSLGLDGEAMQKESRESVKRFREEAPQLSYLVDLVGSAHGWVATGGILKALKGGQIVAKAPTVRRAANAMGIGLGGRLAGESEGDLGDRAKAGATGYAGGAALGAGLAGTAMLPVVGQAATVGLGLGAVGAGIATGGAPEETTAAGVGGAVLGAGAALTGRYSPMAQKLLSNIVTRVNTSESLRTAANMFRKLLTSETAEEATVKLNDRELLLSQIVKHVPEADKKAWVTELKSLMKDYPEIEPGLLDVMKNVPKSKTLTKIMMQMGEDPNTAYRLNKFVSERSAGRTTRFEEVLGPLEGVEKAATQLQTSIKKGQEAGQDAAEAATTKLYAAAEKENPILRSPEIERLLSIDEVQTAIASARKDIGATLDKGAKQQAVAKHLDNLSKIATERLRAGQPIDDLLQEVMGVPDNALKILHLARAKLLEQAKAATNPKLRKDIYEIRDQLTTEMNRLNPKWEESQAAYEAAKGVTDALRGDEMKAIVNLSEGKVEQALSKVMNLAPSELEKVVAALETTPYFQENPTTLADAAKAYLIRKIKPTSDGKPFTKDLINKGEKQNLETLLGEDEFASIMSMAEAEGKTAATEKALAPGSHTASMTEGKKEFDAYSGKKDTAGTAADILGTTWLQMGVRAARVVLNKFLPKADPAKVEAAADMLLLKAEDGIAAMENVLRKEGLSKEAIARMAPYLQEWHRLAVAGAGGSGVTTVTSGMSEDDRANLGKPRSIKRK